MAPGMTKRPEPMPLYDWAMAFASLWISGGILYDSWHHYHETIETFFEPGHAMLYAGLLAAYVFTGITIAINRRRGFATRDALPRGYEATAIGLGVFLIGGVLDMIKHSLWGFEEAFNALVSPPHLVIGAGMFLVIAGVIGSGFARRPRTLIGQLPMLAATASMMELVHWGMQFIFESEAEKMNAMLPLGGHPHDTLTLVTLQYYKQAIGLMAVIVQSLLIAGFGLFLARRIGVARGGYVLLFTIGNIFIAGEQSTTPAQFFAVLIASVLAGACADAFAITPASPEWRVLAFAFCTPAVYWAAMLALLAATMGGLWWTPDIISGSVIYAGLTGALLTMLGGRTADSDRPRA